MRGAGEVGFTIVSITLSLVAAFLPILLMSGIVGRLFREFAMTLAMAIFVSMAISLTTTPMMCALFLRIDGAEPARSRRAAPLFERVQGLYRRTLSVALDHSLMVLLTLFGAVALNLWLIIVIPKSFFPEQDTGRMVASLVADQSISFNLMSQKLTQMMAIVQSDPAVENVVGSTGSGGGGASSQTNTGTVYVSLKPLSERDGVDVVMARLRRKLAQVPGGRLYMQPGAGHSHWRPVGQCRISVHDPRRQYRRGLRMGAEAFGRGAERPCAHRRQFRSAAEGARDGCHDRPRYSVAAGTDDVSDRQHAVRRLRSAVGIDDLQRPQPVSRGDGGRAALRAASWGLKAILGQHVRRASERLGNHRTKRSDGGLALDDFDPVRRVDRACFYVAFERGGVGDQPDVRGREQCRADPQQCSPAGLDHHHKQHELERRIVLRGQQCGAHRRAGYDSVHGEQQRIERLRGFDRRRDDDAASGLFAIWPGRDPPRGQSSEPVCGDDNLVQSCARKVAERRDGRVSARVTGDPPAGRPHRRLRRHGARI